MTMRITMFFFSQYELRDLDDEVVIIIMLIHVNTMNYHENSVVIHGNP